MRSILISRTDSIGDVILTLPMAGIIKKYYTACKVYFLGRKYTQAVIEQCKHVDVFLDWDEQQFKPLENIEIGIHVFPRKEVARYLKKQGVKTRVGTSHRIYHWATCNVRPSLGRKKSPLHEAQLNVKLLKSLRDFNSLENEVLLSDLHQYIGWRKERQSTFDNFLGGPHFNLVLHMKSKGSAKEWALQNYLELIKSLDPHKFRILISGTLDEGNLIKQELPEIFEQEHVIDTTGAFSLEEFVDFIGQVDGLVACSTGPLHIASAAGVRCLGLYPQQKPMHAGRWAPIGAFAATMTEKKLSTTQYLEDIHPSEVRAHILKWMNDV